jgi:23S rRNA (uracil1939-C5)-methyltransferase
VLDVLQRERPRRILYLACVPPVLARDLKALCAGGYEVRRIVPFDMFPQTAHVEVLAELSFSRG